jgi:hypothetical protein
MTKSLGWTMGTTSEIGMLTSLPVSELTPSRRVEARTRDPMLQVGEAEQELAPRETIGEA